MRAALGLLALLAACDAAAPERERTAGRYPAGDVSCGGSTAIAPVAIDNCAWCSFDDHPTGTAPLPPGHRLVDGPLDLHALTDAACAPLDPDDAALVAALRAAAADAAAIARARVQACHGCAGAWDLALDACGLPAGGDAVQRGLGCAVEVSAEFTATCTCTPPAGAPAEICGDGRDNDLDGLTECEDPACRNGSGCSAREAACADGEDNDRDGADDCADPDCAEADGCRIDHVERCGDGSDGDGDGLVDCADPDCADATPCRPEERCDGFLDHDGDGLAGCADPDCEGRGACPAAVERCGDGDDDDGDGLTDCADLDCLATPACPSSGPVERDCAALTDGDGDGLAGCADPDCASSPTCWQPCSDASGCWY